MSNRYITDGNVRGECGHLHRSIEAAAKCAKQDQAACHKQGGYSDRILVVIADGKRREATRDEHDAFIYHQNF